MSVFLNSEQISRSIDSRSIAQDGLLNVGHYLKAMRTRQGLSLQQVSERTHIQPRHLGAIETGNWKKLPEAIYVKGFVKQYARFLGLDGHEIAANVRAEPAAFNPNWLNTSDFRAASAPLIQWWSSLTPLM